MAVTLAVEMPGKKYGKKYGKTSFGGRLQNLRKARERAQVQLADAAQTTRRAVSCCETGKTDAGFPPAPAVIALANALGIGTGELLGVKPPKVERVNDDSETRRPWRRFRMISTLPERDRKAVVRLINSLVTAGPAHRNGSQGERNVR